MAQIEQPLDVATYEIVRNAHPVEILPSILSGENAELQKPPATRPATVGGERRRESGLPSLDSCTLPQVESRQVAALCSPRRVPKSLHAKLKSQISPKSGGCKSIRNQ